MKKLLFIYNSHAGKAKIKSSLSDILERFSGAGYEVVVYPTKCVKDGLEKAKKESGKYDIIACSGGDGTLDEIVSGVLQSGKKNVIGYLPAGSTNDFGASLGLPKNMVKAAEIVTDGKPFSCDIGLFNDKHFVYVAAFGTVTEVSYATPQDKKNALGHAAYLLEALKKLPELKKFDLKIECNGEVVEGEYLIGMITNTTSVGGFKGLLDDSVELNDGLFEVTMLRTPKNPIERNLVMLDLANGTNESGCIFRAKTEKIKVTSSTPMNWTLDGEFGGEVSEADISCLPKAIDIMAP